MRKDTPEEIAQICVGGIIFAVIVMTLAFIAGGINNANGDNYGPGGDNPYKSTDYPDYPETKASFMADNQEPQRQIPVAQHQYQ